MEQKLNFSSFLVNSNGKKNVRKPEDYKYKKKNHVTKIERKKKRKNIEERANTRVSQKFCNILVTWGTVQQLQILLPRGSGEPSSPDTLQVLLTKFASKDHNT